MNDGRHIRSWFHRGHLLDVVAALVVILIAVVAYRVLTSPVRQAPPYADATATTKLLVGMRVPAGMAGALNGFSGEDKAAREPRTNDVLGHIVNSEPKTGWDLVRLHLRVTVDDSGRYYYRDRLVVVGQELRVEGPQWVAEGIVYYVQDGDGISGAS